MRYFVLAVAVTLFVGTAATAYAQSKTCTTTCTSYGSSRTCTKSCY